MDIVEAAGQLPSPCYAIDLTRLEENAQRLHAVRERTGARVLMALKGFAAFATFPLLRPYLDGTCASSVNEAKLGRFEFGGEVHAYAPAFALAEMQELLGLADHVTLNSVRQWEKFKPLWQNAQRDIRVGFRVNPEYSEVEVALYNPCAPCSRLGVRAEALVGQDLQGISGIHFHTLCEQNSDALEHTMEALEKRFGDLLSRESIEWLNMGGGHHITRKDYDFDRLCRVIDRAADRYKVQVYLEPGEAIALHSGYLVSTVLDVVRNEMEIAILDVSVTAHMPDVLEMPYRPEILSAARPNEKKHTYRLGGPTCLAGDVIGDYSFDAPLREGDRLIFTDMAHYTMVKNTTFNGVPLPSIATFASGSSQAPAVIRRFGYEDYRNRLS